MLNLRSGRVDKPFLKAGRKYHAMKAKRNSWPRTRGVAMNPVDREFSSSRIVSLKDNRSPIQIPTEEVTTSTLVTHLPWPEMHQPVKRPVLSPPGEPVCSGVPSTSPPPTNKLEKLDERCLDLWDSSSESGGRRIQGALVQLYASVFTAQNGQIGLELDHGIGVCRHSNILMTDLLYCIPVL